MRLIKRLNRFNNDDDLYEEHNRFVRELEENEKQNLSLYNEYMDKKHNEILEKEKKVAPQLKKIHDEQLNKLGLSGYTSYGTSSVITILDSGDAILTEHMSDGFAECSYVYNNSFNHKTLCREKVYL